MVAWSTEYAIGFLKGCFSSLKCLPINISNTKTHKFATYWIAAAIGIHDFALDCEAEEHSADSEYDVVEDPFVAEGLSEDSEVDDGITARQAATVNLGQLYSSKSLFSWVFTQVYLSTT